MKSIREYIRIIENLNEAWWPEKPAAPRPSNQAANIHGYSVKAPPAPATPPLPSDAVRVLVQYATHHTNGSGDHYDEIVRLATTLKSMAAQHGMQQYIPLLDQILRDPDNSANAARELDQKVNKSY